MPSAPLTPTLLHNANSTAVQLTTSRVTVSQLINQFNTWLPRPGNYPSTEGAYASTRATSRAIRLRIEEVTRMTVGDIDFDRGQLQVLGKGKNTKKSIKFFGLCATILHQYLQLGEGVPKMPDTV